MWILAFLKENLIIWNRELQRERQTDRDEWRQTQERQRVWEILHSLAHFSNEPNGLFQMVTTALSRPGRCQEPRIPVGSPRQVAGAQHLDHFPCFSRFVIRELGRKQTRVRDQTGAQIWDTSTAGSILIHSATMPGPWTPHHHFQNPQSSEGSAAPSQWWV